MRESERFWLAGFLEGEGCFSSSHFKARDGRPRTSFPFIQFNGTDRDVIERAVALVGGSGRIVVEKGRSGPRGPYKPLFRYRVAGARAAEVMREILPLMGSRRAAKIREILGEEIEQCA